MSHEHAHTEEKPNTSSFSGFLVALLLALFVLGLLKFTQSMSHDDAGHGGAKTEAAHGAAGH